jgi:hypothetical protein
MEVAARKGTYRWGVHLGLIAAAALSLALEPILTLHIVLGLVFVALVGAHLVQRRRITGTLARRVVRVQTLYRRGGRLAVADAVLAVVTAAMFVSGSWDWSLGHPTRIRWHALTGFVLAGYLLVHAVRRGARLRSSQVR